MKRLAEQHRITRGLYPEDRLIVVFDIDDTILDLRHMILHVLSSFDEHHHTGYFQGMTVQDIEAGELEVLRMMMGLGIAEPDRLRVSKWFEERSWSTTVIRDGHRPFPGAMDVIGWLQAQEKTFVGLNTGRPEAMRRETLQCLNGIGSPHGAVFHDRLLFMNPKGWGEGITESKVAGISHFQDLGFRIVAFVDNEPANLQAVAEFDHKGEILLLHADTVCSSGRDMVPEHAVSGSVYDLGSLAA
jgi:hypothetical protein